MAKILVLFVFQFRYLSIHLLSNRFIPKWSPVPIDSRPSLLFFPNLGGKRKKEKKKNLTKRGSKLTPANAINFATPTQKEHGAFSRGVRPLLIEIRGGRTGKWPTLSKIYRRRPFLVARRRLSARVCIWRWTRVNRDKYAKTPLPPSPSLVDRIKGKKPATSRFTSHFYRAASFIAATFVCLSYI